MSFHFNWTPLLRMLAVLFMLVCETYGGTNGSISGTVKDASGAVVAGASVTVINSDTGARQNVTTNPNGFYTFPILAVGHYRIEASHSGFQLYRREGVVIDVNSALVENITLNVATKSENVTVTDSSVHVETSSSQMGEVISGETMTAVPLNGRSYTDLLALQPGIAPATSITSATVQDVRGQRLFSLGRSKPRHDFH